MPRRCNSLLLLRAGAVCAVVFVIAGCTKGGQFDPTTLLDTDMFDNKTPLKGQREPVFPTGVPGIATGIPPDLVKGYQPPPDQAADNGAAATNAAAQPPQPSAEPKPKRKPKPKLARVRHTKPRTEIKVD